MIYLANTLKQKLSGTISLIKKYWNCPSEGNYIPIKEVANLSVAGFGINWTSLLAATIGLDAANFLVGASIGIQPMHLQIMLIIANILGIPISIFRGWFLDNHKLKGGKFIPIMLATPVPIVAISTLFVWLPYENFNYVTKVVVVWILFMILQFFLALYNDAWGFFQQIITPNAQERATVMSISQIIYSLAPTITSFAIPTIAGLTYGMNNIWTYRLIYPGFTVVGLIILFIFVPRLKERIVMPKRRIEYISVVDAIRTVAKNKYFWIINGALWIGFLEGAYGVILSWTFVYANGGKDQALLGLANTVIGNAALWSMLLAPAAIKWLGKRNLLIIHNTINIFIMVSLLFSFRNIWLVCVLFYINTFVNTFANIYLPNINADMRDYHQWKTGVRIDGMFVTLGIIGTFISFFTGLVLPAVYEHMGLKKDYTVLYDDVLRNNLFEVLIICSIIGAILNLIPYLFYDLTESKHRGYVNVLYIRAMFEDYGNGELDDNELIKAMGIIEEARKYENIEKLKIDKTKLIEAKKLSAKTDSEKAFKKRKIKEARLYIREQKKKNEIIESLPIVLEELEKYNTKRYKIQLEQAKKTISLGQGYCYDNYRELMRKARALPKKTKEEKEIRCDAIELARAKKSSAKLIKKFGNNYVIPNEQVKEALENRQVVTLKENFEARKELKNYTKGVSRYRRINMPYDNARNIVIQAENYTHLTDIESLYKTALERVKN